MASVSTLGQALDQIDRIKQMQATFGDLQLQVASGKKTQLFKGLGTDVLRSERARADIKSTDAYINNIDISSRRLKLMTTAISEIKAQAKNVQNSLAIQTQEGDIELDSINDLAGKAIDFIVDLINAQDGDRYLFSGSNAGQKPIINEDTLDTYLDKQFKDWTSTTISTDTLIQNYRDRSTLVDAAVGYSSNMSAAGNVFVRVDDASEVDYTTLGNSDGFRDILVAIGAVKKLTESVDKVSLDSTDPLTTVTAPGATQSDQNGNFFQVFNDLASMINGALDKLDGESFKLSQAEVQINTFRDAHVEDKSNLQSIVDTVENADMSETALKLNFLSTQLEASYRITAMGSQLSLVNFI